MRRDLIRRSHEVFSQAIEIAEPAERASFVESSCGGDVRLQRHVQSLLRAMDTTVGFLERPILEFSAPNTAPAPGEVVGGYRIVRQIGVGGMAAVYEAMQESPSRRVALKVMRQGLDGTAGVQRFRFETEVLARLQHPGIAQIYEAGASDHGSGISCPFFAMEYIAEAQPITAFAEFHRLSMSERLEMVADVCEAVHYGHQLGVIHRDLKPANILVDTSGRPRVIDFGVARSTDPTLPSVTQHTDVGQVIGTLNYMSPEQCVGRAIDIRTDIYSLGVVLYELVCRRLPYDLSDLPLPEAARRITAGNPTRPNTLEPHARGDIEAIILKAMDVDPERRYPSAASLAADIRRYLHDQPVEARSPTTVYHLRKFARRHRPVVAAVAAALLILVGGIVSTSRMAILAKRAQRVAEQKGDELEQVVSFQESQLGGIDVQQLGELIKAAVDENVQRAMVDIPLGVERENVAAGLSSALEKANFTTVALRAIDDGILQRWRREIGNEFKDQPAVQARLLQRLASTMNTLGLLKQAEPVVAEALALRREHLGDTHLDTLHSQGTMGAVLMNLGRYEESVALLEKTYQQRQLLQGPDDPATLRTATALGGALRLSGRLQDAERVWRDTYEAQERTLGPDHKDTLRSLNNVGVINAAQGKNAEAEECWETLLERQQRVLEPGHPMLSSSQVNLATIYADRGAYDLALPLLEKVLDSNRKHRGDDHDDTVGAMVNMALVRRELGDIAAAESMMRSCLERRRRVLGPSSGRTLTTAALLASIQREGGLLSEAESLARATLAEQRTVLGSDHADTVETMLILAEVLRDLQQLEEARALATEAIDRAPRVYAKGHWMLACALGIHGSILSRSGRWDEGESAMLDAYESLGADSQSPQHARVTAARALAHHYSARDADQPGKGYDAAAAQWREKASLR